MTCPNCGQTVAVDDKYCSSCGVILLIADDSAAGLLLQLQRAGYGVEVTQLQPRDPITVVLTRDETWTEDETVEEEVPATDDEGAPMTTRDGQQLHFTRVVTKPVEHSGMKPTGQTAEGPTYEEALKAARDLVV